MQEFLANIESGHIALVLTIIAAILVFTVLRKDLEEFDPKKSK